MHQADVATICTGMAASMGGIVGRCEGEAFCIATLKGNDSPTIRGAQGVPDGINLRREC
jgi:hypothetical protein